MEQRGERENLFANDGVKPQSGLSPYTDCSVPKPGWTRLVVLSCTVSTLGLVVQVGYNIGVVNTPAEIIRAFANQSVQTRYNKILNKSQLDLLWSSIVSIFLIGAMIGSLSGSYLADKIGRKGVQIICTILSSLAAVLFFGSKASNSLEMILLGRILVGLSSGLVTCVVPMYLMEVVPLHLRSSTGGFFQLGLTVGVLIGQIVSMHNVLGNDNYWPHCLSVYALPLFLCSALLPFIPESPKYLYVIKKQPLSALNVLKKLRNSNRNAIEEEIEQLKLEEIDSRKSADNYWTLGKVITNEHLRLPLLLVCLMQAGQQLSGINAVFYYSNDIFKSAGLSVSARELATIGSGLVNFLMSVVTVYLISKLGRRLCMQISILSAAFFLILLSVSIIYMESNPWVPYVSIIGVLGFVLVYGLGLGPIPYFIGSELFEIGPRSTAMALGGMSNWGANFVVGLTFPTMQSCIGPFSFFVFAGIILALFFFLKWYLPETKDKDPVEIAKICEKGFASRPLLFQNQRNGVV